MSRAKPRAKSRTAARARTGRSASGSPEGGVRQYRTAGGPAPDDDEVDVVTLRLICGDGITLTVTDPGVIALVLQHEKERRRLVRAGTA